MADPSGSADQPWVVDMGGSAPSPGPVSGGPDPDLETGLPAPKYDLPPIIPAHDAAVSARVAGYGWGDIQQHVDDRTQDALGAGYSQSEIDAHLGFQGSAALGDRIQRQGEVALANPAVTGHPIEQATRGFANAPGSATATNPLPSDVAESYARALTNGETKGPDDFARTYTDAATRAVAGLGVLPPDHMDSVASDLAAQLPTHEDVTDAAIAAVHASGHAVTPAMVSLAKDNILDRWVYTQYSPAQSAHDAQQYPDIADSLTRPEPAMTPPSLADLSKPGRDAIFPTNFPVPPIGPIGVGAGLLGNPEGLASAAQALPQLPGQVEKLAGHITNMWKQGQSLGEMYDVARDDPAVNFLLPALLGAGVALKAGVSKLGNLAEARRLGTAFPEEAAQKAATEVAQNVVDAHADHAADTFLRLYHGTPHTFPAEEGAPLGKFSAAKIGTGEGVQAYGHGLYFAENLKVAEGYQENLQGHNFTHEGELTDQQQVGLKYIQDNYGFADTAQSAYEMAREDNLSGTIRDAIESLDPSKLGEQKTGQLYAVNLHANPDHFLDYDKPLSQQHPVVQAALKKAGYDIDENASKTGLEVEPTGEDIVQGAARNEGSEQLAADLGDRGIPGIKYLDAGSRATDDETDLTRNYVVFNPEHVSIAARSGETVESYLARTTAAIKEAQPGLTDTQAATSVHASIMGILKRLGADESGKVQNFWRTAAQQSQAQISQAARQSLKETLRMNRGQSDATSAIAKARLSQYYQAVEKLMPQHLEEIPKMQQAGSYQAYLHNPITDQWGSLDPISALKDYVENYTTNINIQNPFPAGHPLNSLADTMRDIVRDMKSKLMADPNFDGMAYREDYMRHAWVDTKHADQMYGLGRQGSAASTRARTIPTEMEGIFQGGTPRFPNPIENTLHSIKAMSDYKAALDTLQTGRQLGHVTYGPSDRIPPREGYERLQGRSSQIAVAPGIIQHAWAPKGYARAYNSWVGRGFYDWPQPWQGIAHTLQYAANTATSLKLGLSQYHLMNIAQETSTAALARGLGNLAHGELLRGMQNIGMGALVMPEIARGVMRGRQLQNAYLRIGTPSAQDSFIMDLWRDAGGAAGGRTAVYKVNERENLWTAFRQGSLGREMDEDWARNKATFFPNVIGRAVDTINAPLFDGLIPHVKRAAFAGEMLDFIRRNPGAGRDVLLNRARETMDSMDDRFGELNQDNLFWPRLAKQFLNLATVSVGWEFGTLRAFGQGAADLTHRPFDSTRARWLLAFPMANAIQSSMYQYLHTGTTPFQTNTPARDILAPRTGGTVPGSKQPERAVLPGYQKEVIRVMNEALKVPDFMGALQAVGGYAGSKLNPFWQAVDKFATDADWDNKSLRLKYEAAHGAPPNFFEYASQVLKDMSEPIVAEQLEKREKGSHISDFERFMGLHPPGQEFSDPQQFQQTQQRVHDSNLRKMRAQMQRHNATLEQ